MMCVWFEVLYVLQLFHFILFVFYLYYSIVYFSSLFYCYATSGTRIFFGINKVVSLSLSYLILRPPDVEGGDVIPERRAWSGSRWSAHRAALGRPGDHRAPTHTPPGPAGRGPPEPGRRRRTPGPSPGASGWSCSSRGPRAWPAPRHARRPPVATPDRSRRRWRKRGGSLGPLG